jgi:hypothetical protein
LLNALVEKELHAEANVMAAEGWKWIAAAMRSPTVTRAI